MSKYIIEFEASANDTIICPVHCDGYCGATTNDCFGLLNHDCPAKPAPDLREAMLANALLSSVYTYDGHLKGRDVVFCDHCNAEPVDKLEGTLVHDARCPIKLATDILTTPAQPEKG